MASAANDVTTSAASATATAPTTTATTTTTSASASNAGSSNAPTMPSGHRVVLVHGGAWSMPDYFVESYTAGVEAAAIQGYKRLVKDGGPMSLSDRVAAQGGAVASYSRAVRAVEAAVETMENTPIFNAGTGSSLTADGKVEMDAFIMDGRNLAMGAVCNMKAARNAVSVARIVMEHSRHCLLAGTGADGFATHMGANLASQAELKTEQAQLKLLAARHRVSYPRMLEAAASVVAAENTSAAAAAADAAATTAATAPESGAANTGAAPAASPVLPSPPANTLSNSQGTPASMPPARLLAEAGVVFTKPVAVKPLAVSDAAATKPKRKTRARTILPRPTVDAVLNTTVGNLVAKRILRRRTQRATRARNAATSPRSRAGKRRSNTKRAASPSPRRGKKGTTAAASKSPVSPKSSSSVAPPLKRQRRATKGKGKQQQRRGSLKKTASDAMELTPTGPAAALGNGTELPATEMPMDTVGAVALDSDGHVAAATSTGGTTNKAPGRVGDSPLAGSGGYADDEVGAVSTTGQGEAIMRVCLAMNALDRVRAGDKPTRACSKSLEYMRERVKGVGGLIMVTPSGEWVARCSTSRMAWACVADGVLYSGVTNGSSVPPDAADADQADDAAAAPTTTIDDSALS